MVIDATKEYSVGSIKIYEGLNTSATKVPRRVGNFSKIPLQIL